MYNEKLTVNERINAMETMLHDNTIKCQDRMYKKYDIKMYNYSLGCI